MPGSGRLGTAMTVEATRSRERSLLQNLMDWARRSKLERRLAVVLVVLGLIAGTATFGVMTGDLPITAEPQTVLLLLITDLIVLLGLSALIARRLALLWIQRKQGLAGAHLHGRLVALFSVVRSPQPCWSPSSRLCCSTSA